MISHWATSGIVARPVPCVTPKSAKTRARRPNEPDAQGRRGRQFQGTRKDHATGGVPRIKGPDLADALEPDRIDLSLAGMLVSLK